MKNVLVNSWRHWYKSSWNSVYVLFFPLIKWLFKYTMDQVHFIVHLIECLCFGICVAERIREKRSQQHTHVRAQTQESQVNTHWTMMIERMQMTYIGRWIFQLKSKLNIFLIVLVTYAYYNVIIQFIGCNLLLSMRMSMKSLCSLFS